MDNELLIQQCAKDLIAEFGCDAEAVAERKMKDLMQRNDAKEASLWMAVMYEIHRNESPHVH